MIHVKIQTCSDLPAACSTAKGTIPKRNNLSILQVEAFVRLGECTWKVYLVRMRF